MKTNLTKHSKPKPEAEVPPVTAAGWLRTFSSLQIPNYRWYWFSTLFSFIAMQMQLMARGWLIYEMTDSPLALGLVSIAWGVPVILFIPLGGVLADRIERKKLIILTQIPTGLITLALTILILTGLIEYWYLFGAAFLTGISDAFNMPARQAIVPQLVGKKQLLNAIALSSSGMNLTRIVAPAMAGMLIGMIGISGVYIFVTGCYVIVIGTMLMLSSSAVVPRLQKTSLARDLVVGFHYIRHNPPIMVLLLSAFVTIIFGFPYMMLMPIFARDVLNIGPEGLGLLMSATGCGALAGSLGIASLGHFKRKGWLLLTLGVVFGAGLVLFASSKSLYLSLFLLFIVGVGSAGYFALNNTLIQSNITGDMRGRVMAIFQMTFGLHGVGTLFISGIAEATAAPLAVGAGGAILVLSMIAAAVLMPGLRRLE
ncbi:MFS transporter [Chloroflexota bacterium]